MNIRRTLLLLRSIIAVPIVSLLSLGVGIQSANAVTFYRIAVSGQPLCVDAKGPWNASEVKNGTPVQLFPCNYPTVPNVVSTMKFLPLPVSPGVSKYNLIGTNKCLDVNQGLGKALSDGIAVVFWDCNSATSWGAAPINDRGVNNIRTKLVPMDFSNSKYYGPKSFCLDVYGRADGGFARGDLLKVWSCWGGKNQTFDVMQTSDGGY
jgi:hypothetical protein